MNILNPNEEEMKYLLKNLTSNRLDNDEYETNITKDYQSGRMIAISATEYKNMIITEYFVNEFFKNGGSLWQPYSNCLELAKKQYEMTMNIANRVKDKIKMPKKEPKNG